MIARGLGLPIPNYDPHCQWLFASVFAPAINLPLTKVDNNYAGSDSKRFVGPIEIYMHFISFCLVFITGGRCIKFKSHGQLGHRGHGKMLICSTGQDRRISCQEIRLEVNIR